MSNSSLNIAVIIFNFPKFRNLSQFVQISKYQMVHLASSFLFVLFFPSPCGRSCSTVFNKKFPPVTYSNVILFASKHLIMFSSYMSRREESILIVLNDTVARERN